jgi:hypothetical protein
MLSTARCALLLLLLGWLPLLSPLLLLPPATPLLLPLLL